LRGSTGRPLRVVKTSPVSCQAGASYERALNIYQAAYGPSDLKVGQALNNLGNIQRHLGNIEDLIANLKRAQAIYETSYRPDHPAVSTILQNLHYVQHHQPDTND
jgi:hypothetical protein